MKFSRSVFRRERSQCTRTCSTVRTEKLFDAIRVTKTIGDAIGMSRNTVKKYVDGLIKKRLIEAEPTKITTKHGQRNGNLCYTVRPIDDAVRANYDRQMTRLEEGSRRQKSRKKLAAYDRKHPNRAI